MNLNSEAKVAKVEEVKSAMSGFIELNLAR